MRLSSKLESPFLGLMVSSGSNMTIDDRSFELSATETLSKLALVLPNSRPDLFQPLFKPVQTGMSEGLRKLEVELRQYGYRISLGWYRPLPESKLVDDAEGEGVSLEEGGGGSCTMLVWLDNMLWYWLSIVERGKLGGTFE
ncbi:hypothetical protein FRC12_002133 [Ceratobasidium sp. 428]|nr:hypothetical protein FRC12_002133 [Ceratobasidium sp. 428]